VDGGRRDPRASAADVDLSGWQRLQNLMWFGAHAGAPRAEMTNQKSSATFFFPSSSTAAAAAAAAATALAQARRCPDHPHTPLSPPRPPPHGAAAVPAHHYTWGYHRSCRHAAVVRRCRLAVQRPRRGLQKIVRNGYGAHAPTATHNRRGLPLVQRARVGRTAPLALHEQARQPSDGLYAQHEQRGKQHCPPRARTLRRHRRLN